MKRKSASSLLVLCAFCTFFLTPPTGAVRQVDCAQLAKEIAERRGRIGSLQESLKGLNPKDAGQRREIAALNAEITRLRREADNLQRQADALPCAPAAPPRVKPSDVFFYGEGESKPKPFSDFHPLVKKPSASIVSKGVTLRGWLVSADESGRVVSPNVIASGIGVEDVHYSLLLDADFIAAEYGGGKQSVLSEAHLRGNPTDPNTPRVPVADRAPDGAPRGVTMNSFWLPDAATAPLIIAMELNCWHTNDSRRGAVGFLYNNFEGRGPAPAGWVHREYWEPGKIEPNPDAADSWWPYDPSNPDNLRNDRGVPVNLKLNDYVEVVGTLWQDSAHTEGRETCWTRAFRNYGGWLEIHPPDSIRRLPEPRPMNSKTVIAVSECVEGNATITRELRVCPEGLSSPGQARDGAPTGQQVHFVELVDGRFTAPGTTVGCTRVKDDCLEVRWDVSGKGGQGRLKATYVVWWDNVPSPPPPACLNCQQFRDQISLRRDQIVKLEESKAGLNPRSLIDRREMARIDGEIARIRREIGTIRNQLTSAGCPF